MYVCVCACLSVCLRKYLCNHTRDLYQIFVDVAYDRGSVLPLQGDGIPRGRCSLWGFFPIDNALYSVAFGTHKKTAEPI